MLVGIFWIGASRPLFGGADGTASADWAMQTVDIRSRFEATSVVRLQGTFAAEQAAAMQKAV